jgi:hypothetical protein
MQKKSMHDLQPFFRGKVPTVLTRFSQLPNHDIFFLITQTIPSVPNFNTFLDTFRLIQYISKYIAKAVEIKKKPKCLLIWSRAEGVESSTTPAGIMACCSGSEASRPTSQVLQPRTES